MCYDCGSAERPSVRIMNDGKKKERKNESEKAFGTEGRMK
jgi:hypothetical protein